MSSKANNAGNRADMIAHIRLGLDLGIADYAADYEQGRTGTGERRDHRDQHDQDKMVSTPLSGWLGPVRRRG
jgi:hypothetical protein